MSMLIVFAAIIAAIVVIDKIDPPNNSGNFAI